MIKIFLNGCNGKMGQVIVDLVDSNSEVTIVAGADVVEKQYNNFPVFTSIIKNNIPADVVIDFSNPLAFNDVLTYCQNTNTALVMATTGLKDEQLAKLQQVSLTIPVFFSANMSMGVNLVMSLCKQAASFLEDSFDIEIIEKHHNQKIDAPSGTALAIADSINKSLEQPKDYIYDRQSSRKKRSPNEIGIHSIRGGNIVGEHTIIFSGHNEIIEIKHEALSKDIFANGAIKAAIYLNKQPSGFYTMNSMLKT
ncbi:MAG: 4-hydroxy-tetrahydrodipicolinate reductase [Clostridiales bacterium]|nr:4-hydroxy-tetrahydrodipicolinate reductase [Clostridiales bacterium]